jgi:hypothetical protein
MVDFRSKSSALQRPPEAATGSLRRCAGSSNPAAFAHTVAKAIPTVTGAFFSRFTSNTLMRFSRAARRRALVRPETRPGAVPPAPSSTLPPLSQIPALFPKRYPKYALLTISLLGSIMGIDRNEWRSYAHRKGDPMDERPTNHTDLDPVRKSAPRLRRLLEERHTQRAVSERLRAIIPRSLQRGYG